MKKSQTALSPLKREFQKDLELFKHFLLLLNDTSPIRNLELMWHEEDFRRSEDAARPVAPRCTPAM